MGNFPPRGEKTVDRSDEQSTEVVDEGGLSESGELLPQHDPNEEDGNQAEMIAPGRKKCTATLNTANRNYDVVTTEEVITRTALDSTISRSESESEQEENTTPVYPATPTSSRHSDTRGGEPSNVHDLKTQWPNQGEWRLGQPYFRDSQQHRTVANVLVGMGPMQPPRWNWYGLQARSTNGNVQQWRWQLCGGG